MARLLKGFAWGVLLPGLVAPLEGAQLPGPNEQPQASQPQQPQSRQPESPQPQPGQPEVPPAQPGQPQSPQPRPGQPEAPPAQAGQPQPQRSQPGVPQTLQPQAAVVATVNGEPILESEVQAQLQAHVQEQEIPPQAIGQLQAQVVESLVESRLVEQFVLEKGPQIEADEVEGIVGQIKQRVEQQGTSFEEFLQMRGQSEEMLRKRVSGLLAWQKYVGEQLTEDKLRQFFEERKHHFDGTEVRARHLLVKAEAPQGQPPGPQEQQATLAKVQQLRQAIDEGLDFAQAAQEYSEDPGSATNGGDLGFFPRRGKMVEPIAQAAFELEPGEVSQPVQTEFGQHLIQVIERKEGNKSFAEAQEEVAGSVSAELWNRIVSFMRQEAAIRMGDS